jgi:hypothetical protein
MKIGNFFRKTMNIYFSIAYLFILTFPLSDTINKQLT